MSLDELIRIALLALPFLGALAGAISVIVVMNSSLPIEKKYGQASSGAALFNEAFHPSAANALRSWEQEKQTVVPAPSPDKGPGVVDFARGTIRLDIPAAPPPNPRAIAEPAPDPGRVRGSRAGSAKPGNDEGPAGAGPS